jgi:hypothetical protein
MKDQLTNEKLKGLFKSNFELAKYAIRLGKYYIKSGRELNVDELLEEIRKHPDEKYLNDLQEWDAREKEEQDAEGKG